MLTMDILKTSIDWTKAEVFSSMFFILFGGMFLSASFGFWQFGKTELSKAYAIPTLVAGTLVLLIGLGIFIQSYGRITGFETAYNTDASGFFASEIARAEKVLRDYNLAVFRIIPLIVAACAILFLFVEAPVWRASLVTTITLMGVVLLVDTNASARLDAYRDHLVQMKNQEN